MIPQEPEVPNNNSPEPTGGAGAAEIEAKQAPDEESQKAAEYLANWQRAQADFINYKRRNEQEREEFNRFANANLMLSLLPIIDDFERAFNSIPPELEGLPWVDGLRLIERKLKASLEAQGLAPIKTVGEPFDPRLHEALRQDRGQDGIVIEEFLKGYTLHDRLLRPARVVVGNGEGAEKKEDE